MRMNCFNCGYGYAHYNKGVCDGVDCSKDNLRFIPAYLITRNNACPAWIEKDED